jgi:hypothetical protein
MSELNHIFFDYVTTPNEHFIRKENSSRSINNYNRLLPNISAYIEFPNVSHV